MKKPLLAALVLLATSGAVHAQDYEKLESTELDTQLKKAPFYKSINDTTKASFHVLGDEKVTVIGRLSPKWAVVKRDGFTYYMPARYLYGFSPTAGTPAWIDAVDELPKDAQGHIVYSEVIPVDGASKNELYTRGKLWFVDAFRSAQHVLQADDKEAGLLVGKALSKVTVVAMMDQWTLHYTVKLSFKDGRYRYEITDFAFQQPITTYQLNPVQVPAEQVLADGIKKNGKSNAVAVRQKNELNHQAKMLIRSLQVSMKKTAAGGDW